MIVNLYGDQTSNVLVIISIWLVKRKLFFPAALTDMPPKTATVRRAASKRKKKVVSLAHLSYKYYVEIL